MNIMNFMNLNEGPDTGLDPDTKTGLPGIHFNGFEGLEGGPNAVPNTGSDFMSQTATATPATATVVKK